MSYLGTISFFHLFSSTVIVPTSVAAPTFVSLAVRKVFTLIRPGGNELVGSAAGGQKDKQDQKAD
jgi:hypothetical protein